MLSRLKKLIRNRWHPLWRLRKYPTYRWLQRKLDRRVYVRLPQTGLKVAVKLLRDASWIATPASLEPEIRSAFALVLDEMKPQVFWDVGANIGFYSWLVRKHPSVTQVVMFEPDPTNFGLLEDTLRKNAILDCRAMNLALSDRCGETTFLVDRSSGATGALESISQRENKFSLHHAYQMTETISVTTATFDSLIAGGLTPPDFIKIDVEGAEQVVLAGAPNCLSTHKPVLIVETSDIGLVHWIRDQGYRAFQIDSGNALFIPRLPGLDCAPFCAAFSEHGSTV